MSPGRAAGLAAAAAFAAFLPSLSNGFVLDDVYYVVLNPVVSDPSLWPRFWTEPTALLAEANLAGQVWRPLAGHWFGLLSWGLGKNPYWFHLGGALLHAVCAALTALLASRLAGPAAALPAAFLFALHPAQAEAAAYAGNSPGLLAAAGVLAALLLHDAGRRKASVAVGAAALLCRESAAVLPALVWAWDRVRGEPRAARAWAPHAGALIAYLAARTVVLGAVAQREPWGGDWLTHYKLALRGLGIGFGHLAWPADLRVCYSLPEAGGAWAAAAAALAFLALCGAALWGLRGRRPWGFGLALAGLAFLPVSNLVPVDALAADRFLYMPLAGLGLAFGAAAAAWTPLRRGAAAAALSLAFLPPLLDAQLAWQDGFQLDLAAYAAAPDDPCTPLNLSAHYVNWGMLGRARSLAAAAAGPESPSHLRREAERRTALCDALSAARSRGRAP